MKATRERLSEQVVVGIVYLAAVFVSILDTTIVNVALPTVARHFDVPTASAEWVVTGYLLSLAVWIPASGWLSDRFGTKRVMLCALALFTAASLMCGLARSLNELIAFRVVQGIGGGMLMPVGMAMLFRVFPPERRAVAARVLIVPMAIAPASGPIVGGLLIDKLSWEWVFFVNVPLGIGACIFGLIFLKEHRHEAAGGFDLPGFVLAAAALALLLFGLSEGPTAGWGSPRVLLPAAGAIVAAVLLVVVELRVAEPMLNFRLLEDRLFRRANAVSVFASGSFLSLIFIIPTFLQDARGASPLTSGLTTFPEAIGVLTGSQVAGRIYPKVGPRRLMMWSLAGMALFMLLLSRVELDTSFWTVRILMYCTGFCFSFMIMSLQTATMANIAPPDMARASAMFAAQMQMAAAIGVAVIATCLAAFLPGNRGIGVPPADKIPAFQNVLLIAAGIAAAGILVAARIHDRDAAGTMAGAEPAMVH